MSLGLRKKLFLGAAWRSGGGFSVSDPLCELRGVSRAFELHGQRVPVLEDVVLSVAEGDTVAITGPSGSGKSTLLSILGLVDLGYSGEYRFQGQDARAASESRRSAWRRAELGIAFQDLWLVDSLTAHENVLVPQYADGRREPEAVQRATELLEAAGLAHCMGRRPMELSGGERRRVAVARAFANRPRLLLVDEPTAELDDESAAKILALLRHARDEGTALVAASHDPAVLALCSRRFALRQGRLSAVDA